MLVRCVEMNSDLCPAFQRFCLNERNMGNFSNLKYCICTFSVDGIVGCTSLLTCRIVVVAYKCGHEDRPRDCVTCLSMLSKPDTV